MGCAVALTVFLNGSCAILSTVDCADQDESATIDVSGLFRYSGNVVFSISGTIEFLQEGNTVHVLNTTYDLGDNRALMGEGTLVGNVLDIQLVPINGDTDFRADVFFIFNEDGNEFCVRFSDTNGDSGDLGSFTGRRVGTPAP